MQVNPTPNRRREVLLLILGILGILGLFGRAAYLVVTGIVDFDPAGIANLSANILDALSMVFCAGLVVPMIVYGVRRLKGGEVPPARVPPIKFWQLAAIGGVWLVSVLIAAICTNEFTYGWIVAAPFFLLGIALPILAMAWIAVGGQPAGSRRRLWATFSLSMVGSTVLAVLAEYAVLGLGLLAIGIGAIAHPEWMTAIQQLKDQVAGAGDVEAILTVLAPYLTNPLALLAVLAFVAGIGPLIEEAAKPAVLWLLGKSLRSPAEGFALGALCGAGFALLEGMMAASGAAEMLGVGMAGRVASSLMHITASGLVGWGIASARLEKRPGRFVGAYLLAVTLHGLWNGSAVLAVFGALRSVVSGGPEFAYNPDLVGMLAVLAGLGLLATLLVAMLVVLPLLSARLRLVSPAPTQAPVPVPPPADDIIAPPIP